MSVNEASPFPQGPDLVAGSPTEAELVLAAVSGDQAATQSLWQRTHPRLVWLAQRFGAGPDAEDQASEAFEKTLAAARTKGGHDFLFASYAKVVLRNSVTRLAKERTRVEAASDSVFVALESACASEQRPFVGVGGGTGSQPVSPEDREFYDALHDAVFGAFSQDEIDLLLMTPAQYASAHGVDPEAARTRKYRFRRDLKVQVHSVMRRFSAVGGVISGGVSRLRTQFGSVGAEIGSAISAGGQVAMAGVAALVIAVGAVSTGVFDGEGDKESGNVVVSGSGTTGDRELVTRPTSSSGGLDDRAGTSGNGPGSWDADAVPGSGGARKWGSDPFGADDVKVVLGGDGVSSGTVVDLNPSPESQQTARDLPVYVSLFPWADLNGDGRRDALVEVGSDPLSELGIPWPDSLRIELDFAEVRDEIPVPDPDLDGLDPDPDRDVVGDPGQGSVGVGANRP